jgi:hypothetical protein
MDDRTKYDLKAQLKIEAENSWFGTDTKNMPSGMREEIAKNLAKVISESQSASDKIFRIIARSVAAACLISFILFTYEQFYSIKKLNNLEQRIAESGGSTIEPIRSQNELLIINTFFSWADIKRLANSDFETAYEELFPVWFQNNMIGDGQVKMRIQQYIQEYQLATKIHLP